MDNLRLYNNLAAYSADVTRKYPTVSAIDEGRGSIKYIKKIASDTSNLPLMNLARAANWVASDATFMTNEDAEKVTDITVSKGVMTEGYIVELNFGDDAREAVAELNNGVYTGTANIWLGDMNMYFTSNSGNWALYGTSSPFNLVTVTAKSSAQSTVNLDGTDYTGYVYSVVTANGNKSILLVEGGDFQGIDVTDSSAMSQCAFLAENSMLTYNIEYGTAEIGGGVDVSSYLKNLVVFDEFKWFTSVTEIYSAFSNSTNLTRITIPDSVTYMNNYVFSDCTNLTSVTIGNSVTEIGANTFLHCTGLTSVTIGNSVTSIGSSAFNGCSGLTSVTIPNSVTSIGDHAFYNCYGLTSITIPNSVTSIGRSTFEGCTALTSINIPNSVTSISGNAFEGCSGLTSVVWNAIACNDFTYNNRPFKDITSIGSFLFGNEVEKIPNYLCYELSGLTSIEIPNSVTSIGNSAFNGCSGLTSVTIPNSVTEIGGYAFSWCTGLTSITIGNSVTEIGDRAFFKCTALTSITIPNSVTKIGGYAFSGCSNLSSITSLATTAPTISNITFQNIKTGGTLYYPSGSDYSAWMQTGDYYLGKYNWTAVAQ